MCSGRLISEGNFLLDGTPAKARASAFADFVKGGTLLASRQHCRHTDMTVGSAGVPLCTSGTPSR